MLQYNSMIYMVQYNSIILYGHNFLCADRMRNYLKYGNKPRNNNFLIEYPKLFATSCHWLSG